MIPWGQFEADYSKSLKRSGFGSPAKSVRVGLGSLIVKERFIKSPNPLMTTTMTRHLETKVNLLKRALFVF